MKILDKHNINNLELMDLSSHSASHYGERQINSKGRFCDGGEVFP